MTEKLTELTDEQRELLVVGMEIVVEEFADIQQCSATPFEVMPCQIYDYCDEIYGGDSQDIRSKYKVKTKRPNSRDTRTQCKSD